MKKVLVTLIIISLSVFSFLAGGRYEKGQTAGTGSQPEREILYYSDPMNPGFRSEEPGVAPCGMPLEPVYAEADEKQEVPSMGAVLLPSGAVKITPIRQQLIGVKVAPVEIQPMTYTLRLYGRVVPDETRVFRVNASTDSWIREISDITTGSIVKKNQILAVALAPAYYNAQNTYLIALDNMDRIRRQLGGELRHQQADLADNQVRVSVQTLQNLGITDAQIKELANTREAQPYLQVRAPSQGVVLNRDISLYQWFKAGEVFYVIADIGRVWVYADVYENEAQYLRPGITVKVLHSQLNKTYDAKVIDVLPLFDPLSKTLKVRLDIENPDYNLRPDMFVDVEIPITIPDSMHVSADSVIDSGTQTIVYVDIGNNTFEPRSVETGWRLGRQVQITGGLKPGDKVVVSGNFLIDSESRMKLAASHTVDQTSNDPVCGMSVDKAKAETSGRTVTHADKTYYFCSDYCVKVFTEDPTQYTTDGQTQREASRTEMENDKITAPKPSKVSQGMKHGDPRHDQDGEKTPNKSANSREVVDWNRAKAGNNDSAEKNWRGWGEFPGAEYLGLKDRKREELIIEKE